MKRKIVFRVDASNRIGSGHLVRCSTLASALQARGADIAFICRDFPGSNLDWLRERGHYVYMLPRPSSESVARNSGYLSWLGVAIEEEIAQCQEHLVLLSPDILVVDHYALDAQWELAMKPLTNRIMAIDDLADRQHVCDILLDQNAYLDAETRYDGKVPEKCRLLLGPRYALLREDFLHSRREISPREGEVKWVLVFFGGVDPDNLTSRAIQVLAEGNMGLSVDVVIGKQHPDVEGIQSVCAQYGFNCHVQTDQMAELMAKADLAIGAGGSATWERCALGLPAYAMCIAENQRALLHDAARKGLVYAPDIQLMDLDMIQLHLKALLSNSALRNMISRKGMEAVDGNGVRRVMGAMGISGV